MALEQMNAFLAEKRQDTLGPTTLVGPDNYPMLDTSELKMEHEMLSKVVAGMGKSYDRGILTSIDAVQKMLESDKEQRTRYYLATLERIFAFDVQLHPRDPDDVRFIGVFQYGAGAELLNKLFRHGVDVDTVMPPTLLWLARRTNINYIENILSVIVRYLDTAHTCDTLPSELRPYLRKIRSELTVGSLYQSFSELMEILDRLLGSGLWQQVGIGEVWIDRIVEDLTEMPHAERQYWTTLLLNCNRATTAKPNGKWTKTTEEILKNISQDELNKRLSEWLSLVEKGQSYVPISSHREARLFFNESNADFLRGLTWLCTYTASADICRALSKLAMTSYRKLKGRGPRSIKVGNAAVYVLGELASEDAVAQLAILKVRVKFGTAQIGIEKALTVTAERVGMPRAELEEMSVPAYGLSEDGVRREEFGEYLCELVVDGNKTEMRWTNVDGKPIKTIPASVKKEFAEDLKELKQALADIDKMLPTQSVRIEQLYLQDKRWDFRTWRQRYLDHPLVGTLARRLIWRFTDGEKHTAAIFHGGQFVDHQDRSVDVNETSSSVSLWHPLHEKSEDVVSWRNWLMKHEVQQPFKQAHREVYVLTDAERNTNTYSNRFAAHILKQHQFNALCGHRGWKNKLRLMVDDTYPPAHVDVSHFGLRAEYWVEGAGDEYGVDTNDQGTYLYLVTDQVRFYRADSAQNTAHAGGGGYISRGTARGENEPLPLDEIPAIVFSEVMRDVDLFVGVTSVGNDPNWADGGPGGRYLDYWTRYSFGELGVTSELRKSLLQQLVPMLKIKDRVSFGERFMIVRGDIRTYKIHLGSGNILMEPNDEYLCIVPKQSVDVAGQVFLPFDGDQMMSIILSKAFLLADDRKIKDSSIVSQISRGVPV